jgi:hypothetical protein
MNTLFDMMQCYGKPMTKMAAVRNAIGDVAEQFACAALGMDRLAVGGRKEVCSDALWRGHPVEIKSVGHNGQALIYKFRLEKEMAAHGPDYPYIFVRHDCRITKTHSGQIVEHFRDHPPRLLITTLGIIQAALLDVQPRKFSLFQKQYVTKYKRATVGYNRKGYIDGGWQFNLKRLAVASETSVNCIWMGEPLRVACQHT